MLASHMVNVADEVLRRAFLHAAAGHVSPSGEVFIEHYDPQRVLEAGDSDVQVGDASAWSSSCSRAAGTSSTAASRHLGDAAWEQVFSAEILDDRALDAELGPVGLRRARRLSPTWLSARRA